MNVVTVEFLTFYWGLRMHFDKFTVLEFLILLQSDGAQLDNHFIPIGVWT